MDDGTISDSKQPRHRGKVVLACRPFLGGIARETQSHDLGFRAISGARHLEIPSPSGTSRWNGAKNKVINRNGAADGLCSMAFAVGPAIWGK